MLGNALHAFRAQFLPLQLHVMFQFRKGNESRHYDNSPRLRTVRLHENTRRSYVCGFSAHWEDTGRHHVRGWRSFPGSQRGGPSPPSVCLRQRFVPRKRIANIHTHFSCISESKVLLKASVGRHRPLFCNSYVQTFYPHSMSVRDVYPTLRQKLHIKTARTQLCLHSRSQSPPKLHRRR